LIFSDLHFFHNRLDYLSETCSWIAGQIHTENPDVVVFLGDLNHTHGYVDVPTLDAMVRGMSTILQVTKKLDIPVFMISGNHDVASKDGRENVLAIFDEFSNATCFTTRPGFAWLNDGDDPPIPALFCPYPPTTEKDRADYFTALDNLKQDLVSSTIQFVHWEIAGVPYRPGDKIREGVNAVPASTDGIALRVAGHYHHPIVYDGTPPTVIVGSPCYHNYADSIADSPRGILVLNNEPDESLWCGFDGDSACQLVNGWEVRRIENPWGPIYHTVKAPDIDGCLDFIDRSRVKLRVNVETAADYRMIKPQLLTLRDEVDNLRVVTKERVPEAQEEDEITLPSFDATDVLASYLADKDTTLDKTRLADAGRKLIEEAAGASP
jgi:3',5'-cyclic AMP phosphodiesterase CpdA